MSTYVSEDRVVSSISPRVVVDITIADVARAFSNARAEDQSKILILIAQYVPPDTAGDELGELASRIMPGGPVHRWLLELISRIVACQNDGTSRPVD